MLSTICRIQATTAVAAMMLSFSCPSTVHADTYKIYNLGDANSLGVYGITSTGTVVISGGVSSGCAGNAQASTCFYAYSDGTQVGTWDTAPGLTYDNGSSCAFAPGSGFGKSACNGGHEAFFGQFDQPPVQGLFDGPDPVANLVKGGVSVDKIVMNSSGDIAWTDGRDEWNWEAVNLTTASAVSPEPASLTLLGTGLIGAFGVVRRRLGR